MGFHVCAGVVSKRKKGIREKKEAKWCFFAIVPVNFLYVFLVDSVVWIIDLWKMGGVCGREDERFTLASFFEILLTRFLRNLFDAFFRPFYVEDLQNFFQNHINCIAKGHSTFYESKVEIFFRKVQKLVHKQKCWFLL